MIVLGPLNSQNSQQNLHPSPVYGSSLWIWTGGFLLESLYIMILRASSFFWPIAIQIFQNVDLISSSCSLVSTYSCRLEFHIALFPWSEICSFFLPIHLFDLLCIQSMVALQGVYLWWFIEILLGVIYENFSMISCT